MLMYVNEPWTIDGPSFNIYTCIYCTEYIIKLMQRLYRVYNKINAENLRNGQSNQQRYPE